MVGTVSVVSPLVSSYSIFTVALAWLFLRDLERVSWQIALAAALVVVGVGFIIVHGVR
jgi:drug/metabolite transporter (DMT)-like permease